jgi:hypothetical protein
MDGFEDFTNLQDCEICLSPFNVKRHKLLSLPCGHVFGKKCIEKWV